LALSYTPSFLSPLFLPPHLLRFTPFSPETLRKSLRSFFRAAAADRRQEGWCRGRKISRKSFLPSFFSKKRCPLHEPRRQTDVRRADVADGKYREKVFCRAFFQKSAAPYPSCGGRPTLGGLMLRTGNIVKKFFAELFFKKALPLIRAAAADRRQESWCRGRKIS